MKELEGLPAILDMDDIANILRVSKSSLYLILRHLHAWKEEGEGWQVLKGDLERWLEKNASLLY